MVALRGGKPIRKRGYHRALNRGESWALMDKAMRDIYIDTIKYLLGPSPFESLPKDMAGLSTIVYGLKEKR